MRLLLLLKPPIASVIGQEVVRFSEPPLFRIDICFEDTPVLTSVYIDGFSLYYGCFRGESKSARYCFKWLDLRLLANTLIPEAEIDQVKYFTARVGDTPEDRGRATRQDVYIRALKAHAQVEVIEGRFQTSKREGRLVKPIIGSRIEQMVWIRQEKGSDVALASHLLADAFHGTFDQCLIITNDSDYCEPIRMVKNDFNKRVLVYSPDVVVSKRLAALSDFARPLDPEVLAYCQLPNPIYLPNGKSITKPQAWCAPHERTP